MTNLKRLKYHDVYIFEKSKDDISYKHFIQVLKKEHSNSKLNFTFSNGRFSLHNDKTLKENLILDVLPQNFKSDFNQELILFISKQTNLHAIEIIKSLGNLNRYPRDLAPEELQLFSIAKSIFSPQHFLLFNFPEKNLSSSTLKIVKKAIEFEAMDNQRTIIINSNEIFQWINICTKIVIKNDLDLDIKKIVDDNETPISEQSKEQIKLDQVA